MEPPKKVVLKWLLMAKLILFFLATCCFQLQAMEGYGQAKVSVKLRNTSVKSLIKEIERQTNLHFVYNDDALGSQVIGEISANDQAWTSLLAPLLQHGGLAYEVMHGNTVVIKPDKSAATRQHAVSGVVVSTSGQPLSGVSVMEKGTSNGVSTGDRGEFSLTLADANATLVISIIGYVTQELIPSSVTLRITMEEDLSALDEVVVVGYGTRRKANLTGAVSAVNMDDVLADRPVSNAAQALQGAIPGLQITTNSGQPGTGSGINIRGFTSINGGEPLVLVDNVPMSMADVNPRDISTVNVLKDASAASIYGARAAFGVILITTKRGARNQPIKVDYSVNLSTTDPSTLPEKTTPLQFVQALSDFGTTNYWAGQNIATWLDLLQKYGQNPAAYPSGMENVGGVNYPLAQTDLYGGMFSGGFEQLHNLSASGGAEKVNYRVSLGYANEDGVLATQSDALKRYNFNAYLNTSITSRLSAGMNIFYNNQNRREPMDYTSLFYNAITFGPYANTGYGQAPDGRTLPYYTPNNILEREPPKLFATDNLRLFGQLEYNVLEGLKVIGEYTFDKKTNNETTQLDVNQYINPLNFSLGFLNNNSRYERLSGATDYHALNVYAQYSKTVASDHHIDFMAGVNQESSKQRSIAVGRFDVISPGTPSIGGSTGLVDGRDAFNEFAVAGYFGRANYNYADRYLLELTGRFDGSSRFAEGQRFGFFPSFSAGWNIGEEAFMTPFRNRVNLLKLRGSYGQIGNQVVLVRGTVNQDYYPYLPGSTPQNSAWINPATNIRYVTLPAPGLVSATFTWERVKTLNVGLDIGVLQGRLNGSVDWFRRSTLDMLADGAELPAVLGAPAPLQNVADLKSEGWELELAWKDNVRDFRYSIGFNISDNQAHITRFSNEEGLLSINPNGILTNYYTGQRLDDIWGYVTQGYFSVDDFEPGTLNANLQGGTLKPGIAPYRGVPQNPGDIRYRDLDGDGMIFTGTSTLGNPGDRQVIGNTARRFQYGINGSASYKAFDLSVFLVGVGKRDLWLSNQVFWPYLSEFAGIFSHQLDYWTPERTEAFYPRYYANSQGNTGTSRLVQTKYLSNGAYLRLRNVSLGYSMPQRLSERLNLAKVRIFFSGENLFAWDTLPNGLDAEARDLGSGGIYPFLKKYSMGINVSF